MSADREILEKLRGDIHHNLNSAIGLIRWHLRDSEHMPYLEEHIIPRMYATTDAADAALGERPMREQLAELRVRLAARTIEDLIIDTGQCPLHPGLLCSLHDAWCSEPKSAGPCDCELRRREEEHDRYDADLPAGPS